MKKLTLITLVLFALLAASCTKNAPMDCCMAPAAPYFNAEKDSKSWIGLPEAFKTSTDSLTITGRKTEENLLIRIKYTGKGNYVLNSHQGKYYMTVGQDVMVAEYILDDTAPNTLEVTEYDTTKGFISGKFSITLKKIYGNPNEAYPATIKFLNGTFRQTLPK